MLKWFKELSPTMQIVLVIVIIVLLWMIFRTVKSTLIKTGQLADNIGEQAAYAAQGLKASYTNSQYKSFANKLEWSLTGFNDIEAFYSVYRKMNNDLDIFNLNKAFGTRESSDWSLFQSPVDLDTWITATGGLDYSQIETLNGILESKGITKSY